MIITYYGRHWNRELTNWRLVRDERRLKGNRDGGFNVFDCRGIYLLHDYTLQTVYVGQAGRGERPMGPRLLEHCTDHLWGSWHFYSWFAVEPKKEDDDISVSKMLDELEGLLIYLLVPRLNRKKGNNRAVEITQWFHNGEGVFSPFRIYAEMDVLSRRLQEVEAALRAAKQIS